MMCNVHAGLPELVGELFPDAEVEQNLPHHNHSEQCSLMQCFEGLDQVKTLVGQ